MTTHRRFQIDIDDARGILDRVAALTARHEAVLQSFWNPHRYTFGLESPEEAENHVTTACTCLLSFFDAGLPLPEFLDPAAREGFLRWLLSADWDTDNLGAFNFYTSPMALVTVLALNKDLDDDKVLEAIRALTSGMLDVEPAGPVCPGDYPPNAFLTYWGLRALWSALSADPANRGHYPRQRMTLAASKAVEWVEAELHKQFSYYSVNDLDRFDSAEIAYLLAAADLARSRRGKQPDPRVVRRGLEIFFETQLSNGLWPRSDPIIPRSTHGGIFLFALEGLTTVMRVGQKAGQQDILAGKSIHTGFFGEHLDHLLGTLAWVETNELHIDSLSGWKSNQALAKRNESLRPQSWATAVVMLFARQLHSLVNGMIRDQRLEELKATRHPSGIGGPITASNWTRRADSSAQPSAQEQPESLKELVFHYLIQPHLVRAVHRKWSVILFGPPGTAKTSMLVDLAAALDWPLVRLGTSDFLAEGQDRIAHQAQLIFRRLKQLSEAIVFIDEVEELVRSRKAQDAHPAGRLVTTALLTLLQDLVDAESVLLVMATNHLSDIDPAILRRFNARILVLPPSFEEKLRIVAQFDPPFASEVRTDLETTLEESRATAERLTFGEWKAFLRACQESLSNNQSTNTRIRVRELLMRFGQDAVIPEKEWHKWMEERTYV